MKQVYKSKTRTKRGESTQGAVARQQDAASRAASLRAAQAVNGALAVLALIDREAGAR